MADTTVLVVEDEAVVALDIQRRLRLLGYHAPTVVPSGEKAVAAALASRPDLILMDIMLDGELDGIDAASRIREQLSIPIIYLTAYADEQTLSRAKITGPFGYILKPFEDRELQTCIEMALYKHSVEMRLLENERWLSTTLQSIGDAVLSADSSGAIRFMNPMAEALTGWSLGQASGKMLEEVLTVVEEDSGKGLNGLFRQALCDRGVVRPHCPTRLISLDKSSRPIDLSAAAICSDANASSGVVVVFRDITDARLAEEALRQSVKNLRRTLEETVAALAMTAEKRDPYTSGHQQRVAKLASAVARKMKLPEDAIEGIRVASLLHDLGKIYIPAEILSKPATLTHMEMGIMKTHSEVGYDILKNVSFPWPVADIVLQHHERIDGTGYPTGLSAKNILIEARVIMVADVVEAMSSHRPYRAALGLEKALAEIEKGRGQRYDEEVVDTCLSLFRSEDFRFED